MYSYNFHQFKLKIWDWKLQTICMWTRWWYHHLQSLIVNSLSHQFKLYANCGSWDPPLSTGTIWQKVWVGRLHFEHAYWLRVVNVSKWTTAETWKLPSSTQTWKYLWRFVQIVPCLKFPFSYHQTKCPMHIAVVSYFSCFFTLFL